MGFDFLANAAAAARSSAPSQIKAPSFVLSAAERSWRTLPFIPLFSPESPVAAEEDEDGFCLMEGSGGSGRGGRGGASDLSRLNKAPHYPPWGSAHPNYTAATPTLLHLLFFTTSPPSPPHTHTSTRPGTTTNSPTSRTSAELECPNNAAKIVRNMAVISDMISGSEGGWG